MAKLTILMGVDQSINSTGVCIYNIRHHSKGGSEIRTYYYNIVPGTCMKKKMRELQHPNFEFLAYHKQTGDDYESKEIAKTHNIMEICYHIENLIKKYTPDVLIMEGVSYGSMGSASLVDLAGLNFCIRMIALKHNVQIRLASPMTVKKMATGNGGADKSEMIWAWKHCDSTIQDIEGIKVDDVADAYFLARVYENDYKPL